MAERPAIGTGTTPETFAETTPAPSSADYTTFTLTTVMQLQNAVGGLTKSVETLTKQSEDQGKKVNHLSHVIYAASAVITVLTGIGLFVLNKLSDLLIEALKKNFAH